MLWDGKFVLCTQRVISVKELQCTSHKKKG